MENNAIFMWSGLIAVAAAVVGCAYGLGKLVSALAARYLTDENKRNAAETAMAYIEQVYKNLHGEEKMQKALEAAEVLLSKIGITFDADEMRILIEAAVCAFNAGKKSDKKTAEETAEVKSKEATEEAENEIPAETETEGAGE